MVPVALALGISPTGILFRFINWTLGVLTRMMPGLFGYQVMLVARRERKSLEDDANTNGRLPYHKSAWMPPEVCNRAAIKRWLHGA